MGTYILSVRDRRRCSATLQLVRRLFCHNAAGASGVKADSDPHGAKVNWETFPDRNIEVRQKRTSCIWRAKRLSSCRYLYTGK